MSPRLARDIRLFDAHLGCCNGGSGLGEPRLQASSRCIARDDGRRPQYEVRISPETKNGCAKAPAEGKAAVAEGSE